MKKCPRGTVHPAVTRCDTEPRLSRPGCWVADYLGGNGQTGVGPVFRALARVTAHQQRRTAESACFRASIRDAHVRPPRLATQRGRARADRSGRPFPSGPVVDVLSVWE